MGSEHVDLFLEEFGGIIAGPPAGAGLASEYEHRLPGLVLDFMQEQGFSGFGHGRFWLTDPAVWQASVDMLCEAMDVPLDTGPLTPFGRSAFGALYAWSTRTGLVTFNPVTGQVFVEDTTDELPQDADLVMGSFFSASRPDSFDLGDDQGQYLFDRALERLGPLEVTQVYGFDVPIRAGGAATLEHLERVDALAHLVVLTDG